MASKLLQIFTIALCLSVLNGCATTSNSQARYVGEPVPPKVSHTQGFVKEARNAPFLVENAMKDALLASAYALSFFGGP